MSDSSSDTTRPTDLDLDAIADFMERGVPLLPQDVAILWAELLRVREHETHLREQYEPIAVVVSEPWTEGCGYTKGWVEREDNHVRGLGTPTSDTPIVPLMTTSTVEPLESQ